MEIAIRAFENLDINFTRTDTQKFIIGENEFNVTLTKNNETNKYLAIYKASYPNNQVTTIFHFRETLDPNDYQTGSIKEVLPLILIIVSVFLLILIFAFIIFARNCTRQEKPRNREPVGKIGVLEKGCPKPAGEIPLNDGNYEFNNQNYENYQNYG